jgi:CRP/FNR family transcriptional regulator
MSPVDLVSCNDLFAGLPDEVTQTLAAQLGQRTFARGMVIFHKGSPGQRLYLIHSGQVRIFVLSSDGHEITLNLLGPGECFGELAMLDGGPRSASAIAQERTAVYTLERQAFLDLVETHPALARRAMELVTHRLRHLTAHVESLSFLDITGRVAACLLDLAERHGQPVETGVVLQSHLTQAELASYAGATRESVNKALGILRDAGLVRQEGNTLTILDVAGLRRKVSY